MSTITDRFGITGQDPILPSGIITMWSGSIASIPTGWVLCDGLNGTPDLTNRFVVGAGGSYAVGATGGVDSVTLTETQIPSHSHTASTGTAGSHTHSGSTSSEGSHRHSQGFAQLGAVGSQRFVGGSSDTFYDTTSAGAHTHSLSINSNGDHTHTVTIDATGGDGSHENRPPYYALAYIMRL